MDWLTILISALLSSGVLIAAVKIWGSIRLKKMDQEEAHRRNLEKRFRDLSDRFDILHKEHMTVLEEHMNMRVENATLKREQERLNKLLRELQGYKDQQSKLNRLTKALYEYYRHPDCEKLVKALDKELT